MITTKIGQVQGTVRPATDPKSYHGSFLQRFVNAWTSSGRSTEELQTHLDQVDSAPENDGLVELCEAWCNKGGQLRDLLECRNQIKATAANKADLLRRLEEMKTLLPPQN
jgi:hypothetical protein